MPLHVGAANFYKISSHKQSSLKIVKIDLSERRFEEFSCEDDVLKVLLGGRCLGVGLLARHKSSADPLDPSSMLVIAVGGLAGTGFPLANRLTMVFRSPLTRTVAWTQTGGYAAYELAGLGVNALVITGSADRLSYLLIGSKGVSLFDGENLRGLGAVQTCAKLKQVYGDCRVLAMGPAGERMVKISTVVNDMGRASGVRHGVGAVFGLKNLKAIVLKGRKHEFRRPHNPLRFTRLLRIFKNG
ncbi:MAG: aldehyde ferredoxin oxidoreductase N-terminal domain-containing protein [Candidatus Caldarchaeum sp.]